MTALLTLPEVVETEFPALQRYRDPVRILRDALRKAGVPVIRIGKTPLVDPAQLPALREALACRYPSTPARDGQISTSEERSRSGETVGRLRFASESRARERLTAEKRKPSAARSKPATRARTSKGRPRP